MKSIDTQSKIFLASLLLFIVVLILTPSKPEAYRKVDIDNPGGHSITTATLNFMDKTIEAGLTGQHIQGGYTLAGLDETLGSGACAFDYNNDGWTDLFLVTGSGENRFYGRREWWQKDHHNLLYRNMGNNRFQEVASEAGVADISWGMGCATADLDNDGHPDLLVTNKGKNLLYRNEGNGRFSNVSESSGIAGGDVWSTSATFLDYNRDGLLDIYIVNYLKFRKGKRTFEAQQGFETSGSSNFDATLFDSEPNKLYQNLGNFRFEDVTAKARIDNISGRGLAALSVDYNKDGFVDLIISNDSGFPNAVFKNLHDGTFADVTEQLNLHGITATSTFASGDVDADGDIDLFAGTLKGDSNLLYIYSRDSGRFNERAHAHGAGGPELNHFSTFGALLQDFNNDGWLDIFSANGLVTPDPDNPRDPLGQPNLAWINHDGHFAKPIVLRDRLSNRAAVTADFDNDGDLDIFVTNNNDLGQLLINAGDRESDPRHWLMLKLAGTHSNRDGYGSKLWLTTEKGMQYREWHHPAGFLSNSDHRIHFGLGKSESVLTLKIQWPNGNTSLYRDLAANTFYLINEGDKQAHIIPPPAEQSQSVISAGTFTAAYALYELLLEQKTQDLPTFNIMKTYMKAGDQEKHSLLELFSRRNTLPGLQLLIMALDETSPQLREFAVKKLQQYEEPISNRWLLRAFHDPSPQVRCAVAHAYEHFFREEEAMTKRKYSALPYLIKLLDDPETDVQLCAIHALQEAEHYRSVDGLLNKMRNGGTRQPIDVINQSIRALGLIREGSAIEPLVKLYNNPETTSSTRAYILIALKRLNYKRLDQIYNELLTLPGKSMSDTANKLGILQHIVEQKRDSTVFEPGIIANTAGRWLRQNTPSNKKAPAAGLIPAIRILIATQSSTYKDDINALIRHDDETVRATAYEAIFTLSPNSIANISETGLQDQSSIVRQSVLENLKQQNACPPAALLLKQTNDTKILNDIIELLACHLDKPEVQAALLSISNNDSVSVDARNHALKSLSALKQHALTTSDYRSAADTQRRILLLTIQSNHEKLINTAVPVGFLRLNPKEAREINLARLNIIGQKQFPWSNSYLEDIINDNKIEAPLRAAAMDIISRNRSLEVTRALFNIAKNQNGETRLLAIKALRDRKTELINKWLLNLVRNTTEALDSRIMAVYALFPETRIPLADLTGT